MEFYLLYGFGVPARSTLALEKGQSLIYLTSRGTQFISPLCFVKAYLGWYLVF